MIANRQPAREMPSRIPFVSFLALCGRYPLLTCGFAEPAGKIDRSIFVTFDELVSLAFMSDVKAQIESLKADFIEDLGHLSEVSIDGISLPDAEAQLKQVAEARVKYTGKKSR